MGVHEFAFSPAPNISIGCFCGEVLGYIQPSQLAQMLIMFQLHDTYTPKSIVYFSNEQLLREIVSKYHVPPKF